MGAYRIKIEAVGGHGCGRQAGDGQTIQRCGGENCPDCLAIEFVAKLRETGDSITKASLEHWPIDLGCSAPHPVDNLLTGVRTGSFASDDPPAPAEPIMQFFSFLHLQPHLAEVSRPFCELAHRLVDVLARSPERTVALRKLLEGKDAAVRALLTKP